jgi:putative CocE/NonD family hydrolase
MRAVYFQFLACLLSLPFRLFSQHNPSGPHTTTYQPNVMVTMRDGIRLSANLYQPVGKGPFPVILRRTPYGSGDSANADGQFFARHGYVFVSQNTRGRHGSEGLFDAFRREREDGEDMHHWISEQNWFNGKLATQGGSYVGYTQWMPAPVSPHLAAMFTWVSFSDLYEALYHGGAFYFDFAARWSADMTRPYHMDGATPTDSLLLRRPLIGLDSVLGWQMPFFRDWILHPQKDTYWNQTSIQNAHQDIQASVYVVGGWFDLFLKSTLNDYTRLASVSGNRPEQRHRLVIGPWQHVPGKHPTGAMDFGKKASVDLRSMQLDWFNEILKKETRQQDTVPPVRIFVMGKNEWRYENEWPLTRTSYRRYFLSSSKGANSASGDGSLNPTLPDMGKGNDQFFYDPRNPVYMPHTTGPHDQSEVEKRHDVLVYTTPVLLDDLEVTGPVKMSLYAKSSAVSTDFTAKLVDVHPDGKAVRLCEGIVRVGPTAPAKHPSTASSANDPDCYEIDLWATSNLFRKGHRIRVEISSSNYPKYHPHANTDAPFSEATHIQTAHQTIYHNALYPSHILLPVIDP